MRSQEGPRRRDPIRRYQFAAAFIVTYLVHINSVAEHGLSGEPGTSGEAIGIGGTVLEGGRSGHIWRTTSDRAWTESHSPHHAMDPDARISFRLHDPADVPRPDMFLSVAAYRCGDEKAALPPSLSGRTLLGFTATVATDLRIAHVGDSLGQQFAQGFDAALLGAGREGNRAVLREYFYDGGIYSHNCLSVAAPSRGGGVSAYWRVTDLMSEGNRRKDARCAKEELALKQRVGWSMEQSLELVGHRYYENATVVNDPMILSKTAFPVGSFDGAVLRIPHGWMDVPDITRDRLVEAINLSNENLGVRTVVVTTLPMNNNVLDASVWSGISEVNRMIRDVANGWKYSPGEGGVQWVLVQEFGNFTNQILWRNALHLGYSVPTDEFAGGRDGWELSGTDFLLDRLPLPKWKWPPSKPMVCAKRPLESERDCVRNRISTDGIHWCIETLGPRYAASVACLLGCVYNGNPREGNIPYVRECERECNDRFMSIAPVDEAWIGGDATFFSHA